MSAAAESTMSGGNAATTDDSHLEQPNDAVLMKTMPQPLQMEDKPGDSEAAKHAPESAPEPSSSSSSSSSNSHPPVPTESADPEQPEQGKTSAVAASSSSSKGKEKEDAPAPPAKEDISREDKPQEESQESIMAIGPAQEDIRSAVPGGTDSGPVCNITLLLASGGRHPYKLDAKYLSRRNVAMPDEDEHGNPDPFSISIYTLKELILREWRADWEAKPASPSSIRLIHFGKLLDDKEQLKKYQFSPESPNVVHMSIRPQDLDEEEPKAGSKSLPTGGGDGEGAREGRCCVIL